MLPGTWSVMVCMREKRFWGLRDLVETKLLRFSVKKRREKRHAGRELGPSHSGRKMWKDGRCFRIPREKSGRNTYVVLISLWEVPTSE